MERCALTECDSDHAITIELTPTGVSIEKAFAIFSCNFSQA
jgi:hypothetical protein